MKTEIKRTVFTNPKTELNMENPFCTFLEITKLEFQRSRSPCQMALAQHEAAQSCQVVFALVQSDAVQRSRHCTTVRSSFLLETGPHQHCQPASILQVRNTQET